MAKKSLEELIGQALDNIEHDRQVTEEMLNDLLNLDLLKQLRLKLK